MSTPVTPRHRTGVSGPLHPSPLRTDITRQFEELVIREEEDGDKTPIQETFGKSIISSLLRCILRHPYFQRRCSNIMQQSPRSILDSGTCNAFGRIFTQLATQSSLTVLAVLCLPVILSMSAIEPYRLSGAGHPHQLDESCRPCSLHQFDFWSCLINSSIGRCLARCLSIS